MSSTETPRRLRVVILGAGMIGAITASGLHERDDHRVVVDAICDHLRIDRTAFTLPPL